MHKQYFNFFIVDLLYFWMANEKEWSEQNIHFYYYMDYLRLVTDFSLHNILISRVNKIVKLSHYPLYTESLVSML